MQMIPDPFACPGDGPEAMMVRRVSIFLAFLSLLGCIAITVMWRRSYLSREEFAWVGHADFGPRLLRIVSGNGVLGVGYEWGVFDSGHGRARWERERADALSDRENEGYPGWRWIVHPRPEDAVGFLDATTFWGRRGFGRKWVEEVSTGDDPGPFTLRAKGWAVAVPYWLPALVFALPLMGWLTKASVLAARRRRRIRLGLCPNCAYDLRATPGTCPECGHARPAAAAGEASTDVLRQGNVQAQSDEAAGVTRR
jgi:hypothetical protein